MSMLWQLFTAKFPEAISAITIRLAVDTRPKASATGAADTNQVFEDLLQSLETIVEMCQGPCRDNQTEFSRVPKLRDTLVDIVNNFLPSEPGNQGPNIADSTSAGRRRMLQTVASLTRCYSEPSVQSESCCALDARTTNQCDCLLLCWAVPLPCILVRLLVTQLPHRQ
jgi:hypothetical protein